MSMEQPTFNPRDEKYKKVEDLPKEEQSNFADVEGGFITKKAADFHETVEEMAKPLSIPEKIANVLTGANHLPVSDKVMDHMGLSPKFNKSPGNADDFIRKQEDYMQYEADREKKEELQIEFLAKYKKVIDAAKTGDAEILCKRIRIEGVTPRVEELEIFAKNYIEKNKQ